MTDSAPDRDREGAVDRLLDDLFDRLAGTGAAGRRALTEAEDHLAAAVAEAVDHGQSRQDAEAQAVARFGPVAPVAAELRQVHRPMLAWLRPAAVAAWFATGVGLLAVGLSGALAELFGRWLGAGFVAADAPGVTYTPARCAEYLSLSPAAADCAEAAAIDHWGEIVESRVLVGLTGLVALLVLWWARRRTRLGRPDWTPPSGAAGVPLVLAFGLAGLGLCLLCLMQVAFGSREMLGANLSAGMVALVAAAATLVMLIGRRRQVNP